MIASIKSSFNWLRSGICVIAATFSGLHAFGQLSWDTRQLDFHPKPEEAVVKGEFAFTNIGKTPVTITDVKTSCGCTTAALTKTTYAPGEKGAIATTFTIGDRTGLQQKQVVVRTDFPEEMFIQLTVRVFIPELLKLDPEIIRWPLNAKNDPRIFKLEAAAGQTIKVLGVRATDDRIFAKLKTLEAGKRYEVEVAVDGTAEPMRAFVRVETNYPPQKPKAYNLPVEIGDPPRVVPPVNPVAGAPPYPPGTVPPGPPGTAATARVPGVPVSPAPGNPPAAVAAPQTAPLPVAVPPTAQPGAAAPVAATPMPPRPTTTPRRETTPVKRK
jgi:hypothetical protein